jgi:hypothetical protein
MDLPTALVERLAAATAVTNIVAARIHWLVRPQGEALPAVVLQVATGDIDDDTVDSDETEILTCRVQADCMSRSLLEAWALAQAVKAALRPPATVSDMLFWEADAIGPRNLGEPDEKGFVHRASVDFIIRHSAGS